MIIFYNNENKKKDKKRFLTIYCLNKYFLIY